jgi:hypothetical protein
MASTQRKIVDGPGKFDLMMAIMEGRIVEFTIEGFGKQEVEVVGGRVTDRETESWSLEYKLKRSHAIHVGVYSFVNRQGATDLADDAIPRTPKNGDPAYTLYHGSKWVGVLDEIHDNYLDIREKMLREGRNEEALELGERWLGYVVPANATENWGYHHYTRGLCFGYDEPLKWDAKEGMWYAPADYD